MTVLYIRYGYPCLGNLYSRDVSIAQSEEEHVVSSWVGG